MHKKLILMGVMVFTFALGASALNVNSPVSYADGNGSPNDCLGTNANVTGSIEGTSSSVSHNVGSGNTVSGVCIKSGSGTFNGVTHSGVLGNGIHDNGCYKVEGVGTQTVKVTRLVANNVCKGISHIDVQVEDKSDFCDPTQKPGGQSIGQWVPKEVRCVEPSVNVVCGSVEGTVNNLTPFNYGISWSEGSPDYNFNTSLPVSFPEDYNGGSVEVFYWVVGEEADYVTGRDIPNFWEQNAASVTVNTDCEEDEGNGENGVTPVAPGDVGGGLQALEAPAEAPQAQAPEAGVAAGGAISSVVAYLVALGGSVASMGYGLLRLRNFGA
jgi:hypothetical protein